VVRVILDYCATLQAGKQVGDGDFFLQHFLLSMESELDGSSRRQFPDVTLDQEGLLSSITTTRPDLFSPERTWPTSCTASSEALLRASSRKWA
jgi:hypothetical protein